MFLRGAATAPKMAAAIISVGEGDFYPLLPSKGSSPTIGQLDSVVALEPAQNRRVPCLAVQPDTGFRIGPSHSSSPFKVNSFYYVV